jgi:hypothetical protein
VAGLTIYTATIEKSREYGILKAEGFTNGYLYRVVFEQSLVGHTGFVIGAGYNLDGALRRNGATVVVYVRWQSLLSQGRPCSWPCPPIPTEAMSIDPVSTGG